jgi:hypothetical protein
VARVKRIALLLAAVTAAGLPFVGAAPASAAPQNTYFFAEGTTRPGFEETLFLLNTAGASITVDVEYQFADGSVPLAKSYSVPAASQRFVIVNEEVGAGKDVSVALTSTAPFTASRFINVDSSFGPLAVRGETSLAGITGAGSQWDLGEGTTLPGFQEYITIQNPDITAAAVIAVDYGLEGQPGKTTTHTVPARSRATIDVNSAAEAGPGQTGVSARVRATNGVLFLVERPLYFSHDFGSGPIDGAHVAAGTFEGDDLFFAEGNVLDKWFEFLTLYNPSDTARTTQATYLLEGATPVTRSYTVAARSRRTVQVYTDAADQGVGRTATAAVSKGVSVRLQTPSGIVAERPVYTNSAISRIPLDDGHDATAQRGTIGCAEFAGLDNTTESPSFPFVTLANTATPTVNVLVDLFYGAPTGTKTLTYSIPGQSRFTVDLSGDNPPLLEGSFGIRVRGATAGDLFVAEAPFYEARLAGPDGPLTGPAAAVVLLPTVC